MRYNLSVWGKLSQLKKKIEISSVNVDPKLGKKWSSHCSKNALFCALDKFQLRIIFHEKSTT